MRYRSLFLVGGAVLATGLSLWSDPDNGISTLMGGLSLVQGIWAVALAHLARKAILDYEGADWSRLFAKAKEEPTGAGLALVASAIIFVGLLMVFAPRASAATADEVWAQAGLKFDREMQAYKVAPVATIKTVKPVVAVPRTTKVEQLPPGFYQHGPTLLQEQRRFWPGHPDVPVLYALVEQESCITLKSKGCWNPGARLKVEREEGAGMGQITRTWKKDGSLRFDSLYGVSKTYAELRDLSWDNVYKRPDLQLRALVLLGRDSTKPFVESRESLQFGDAAYNGGIAGVQRERRACVLSHLCNPELWFNNVENKCLKSRAHIHGTRSACDINREHVRNVFLVRRHRYEQAIKEFY